MTFDAWKEANVSPSIHKIDVVLPRRGPKLEPVSSRLVSDLVHPSKSGWLSDIQWSPDGGKIIAADYPGGIVQVWDVATRKQLTKIETGKGYRGSAQFLRVTPDWKTLFVSFEKQKTERLERDGKKLTRYDFDGGVRAWDLETGKLKTLFKHNPPRDVHHMTLSPNGKLFTTLDGISGEYERGYDQVITVWSVDSQQYRSLPKDTGGYEVFSPDGKKIVVNMSDDDGYSTAIKIYDVQTLQELLSIPVASPYSNMHGGVFSPDGKLLVGGVRNWPGKRKYDSWEYRMIWWDTQTGKELASFPAEGKKSDFYMPTFSPDGSTIATVSFKAEENKVLLFDVATRKLAKSITLGKDATLLWPSFSPDGQWIAIPTRIIPKDTEHDENALPDEFPQPRIHVIEAKTGTLRETIVSPPAFTFKAVFSPDGKTLATDGHGKVLLWDLTKPIGSDHGK